MTRLLEYSIEMDGKGVPVCSLCEEEFFLKLRASVRDNEELDLTNEVGGSHIHSDQVGSI